MIWGSEAPVVPRSIIPCSLSTHGVQLHAVPSSVRSHRRVASKLKGAPLPLLNQSDAQTEDGHAKMKFDTFQSFRDLSHAVRGCHNNCRKYARMSQLSAEKSVLMLFQYTHVHASPETSREVAS